MKKLQLCLDHGDWTTASPIGENRNQRPELQRSGFQSDGAKY